MLKNFHGYETHKNLLHKKILTWITNAMKFLFIRARATLEYFNYKRKMNFTGLLSTSSDTCCRATTGGNDETLKWKRSTSESSRSIHLMARSITERITTNKICLLMPHSKHRWPSQALSTLCKMTITRRLHQTIVVTLKQHANYVTRRQSNSSITRF